MSNRQLVLFASGALAVGALLHWLYTRADKRAMKAEARDAALMEMLPIREYVAATLDDPTRAQTFRRHVQLVRESWDRLKPHKLEQCAHAMYARLRQEDPSAGAVFDKQLDWASQTRIFTVMISSLVARLLAENSSTIVVDTLVRLGKRHHELGVRPKHYTSMQRAILTSLEELLGDEWSNEYAEAWVSVFSFISHTMVLGAQEQEEEEPAHPPTPDRNTSTATCAVPFINKYLAVARDTGSTDGHAVQQQQRQQHAPRGHSARIEEEP